MAVDAVRVSPYVGLRTFGEQDSLLFFGREHEAAQLLALIAARPVVLLYSPSGAGKSSLLHARIIPGLKNDGFQVLPVARVGSPMPSGIEPAEFANAYVFGALSSWDQDQTNPRELAQMTLPDYLKRLEHLTDDLGAPTLRVAILDQFEELFTLHPDRWSEREDFIRQLAAALQSDLLLRLVLSMREEYLAQMDPYAALLPDRLRARLRLEPMGPEAAQEALTKPLAMTGQAFAPGVAERLVDDLRLVRVINPSGDTMEVLGRYVEPLQLQVVARSLWSALPPGTKVITEQELQAFGETNQALSAFYEQAIQQVMQQIAVDEYTLRSWFESAILTPAGTRGTVFRGQDQTAGLPNAAIDVLEKSYLIRAEARAGARWYELTHDRLIEPIRASNSAWFETWRQTHRNPLSDAARDWQRLGKDKNSLFGGAQLDAAMAWAARHAEELNGLEQEFLDASIALRTRVAKEEVRKISVDRIVIACLIVALLAAIATIIGLFSSL